MLPNGRELIKRIARVRRETAFTGVYHIPAKEGRLDKAQLKKLAGRYADSVTDRLRECGEAEQAAFILNAPVEFISESEFKKKGTAKELLFINTSMDISDDFIDFTDEFPDYLLGLEEAVLFMTKSPAVTRYILSAIVKYPVDDEAYYELWKGGGDIEFCEDKTLVIIPDDFVG